MKFIGYLDNAITPETKTGVIITNLGTPDAPQRGALRRYLKEFLWDPRVVELPRALWWLILNGIILNIRPARSAAAYRTVWTEQGSPLLLHTQAQARALQRELGAEYKVAYAMRYGKPSIDSAIDELLQQGIERLLVLPLYPQYSGPTTGSTYDAISASLRQRRRVPELIFISQYYDHPAYIEALANSVREHWSQHGRAQRLLLSYHGEPQRYVDAGDPYFDHCLATSKLLAAALDLGESDYQTCFQSRFGREPWLQPYTDEVLRGLPAQGISSVQVLCPGFAADCLETLEEIGVENRQYFLQAGGERYEYIPCLNASETHIQTMADIVHSRCTKQSNGEN